MAAGVPIKAPVAGISCGLVTEGDRFMTMVDIQGLEDFYGDMDFKVGGTKKGITAIQMDTKVHGLTPEIIWEALEKTYAARVKIIDDVMLPCIAKPREELSKYAPKMLSTKIDPEKSVMLSASRARLFRKFRLNATARLTLTMMVRYSSVHRILIMPVVLLILLKQSQTIRRRCILQGCCYPYYEFRCFR